MKIRIDQAEAWSVRTASSSATRRRSLSGEAVFPSAFLAEGRTEVAEVLEVAPRVPRARRAPAPTALELSVEATAGEAYVIATRHPSGALTFHRAVTEAQAMRRGRRSAASTFRFVVPVRADAPTPDTGPRRRSLLGKVFKVVVLKIVDKVTSVAIPLLVKALEARLWKSAGRAEGWLHVTQNALAAGKLPPVDWRRVPRGDQPCLLLIHGTFSNAASAYKGLADSDFFARIAPRYGDRVFAYDHFSLSKTPEENARDLLAAMPDGLGPFDVVTHSRGGLVLRNLVERSTALGPTAKRFRLGHAVLVACPNAGTPIATPARWQDTVGWFANLLELFPDNPFTTAAGFVSEAIVWLARHLSADIRGLHAMDMRGGPITELQRPPGPPAGAYSALAANFEPDANLALRLADLGLDAFFASANDLVVPTEGGWRIDTGGPPAVDAKRIGCFGPGGNVASATGTDVHHVNFFSQPETVEFLVRALERRDQGLPPLSPELPLAARAIARAATAVDGGVDEAPARVRLQMPDAQRAVTLASGPAADDVFELVVLPDSQNERKPGYILASYRGARVLDRFETRNEPEQGGAVPRGRAGDADRAGSRWRDIIRTHEGIKNFVDGKAGSEMPTDRALMDFGAKLFDALFTPDVRRLYDAARTSRGSERLDVIFTSTIPWVAEKPWEFAFDPGRRTFLATEDVHFTRNVITAVPADAIEPRDGPLRMLVVVAQPVGLAALSSEEEEIVIRRGFQPLIEAGLAEVDVLPSATPATLHARITNGRYDIVHFIGHGEFDAQTGQGYLLFETDAGEPLRADARSMREILCRRGIKLVFLNACESGAGGKAEFNQGVAPALVENGLPAVVANQYKVLDPSATAFAQHFYWGLAQGLPLGDAAREARVALNYAIDGETIDWAVPVLYAHDPNARFTQPVAADRRVPFTQHVMTKSRRAARKHAHRVAVWDVAHAYPQLEKTLATLSAAQDRFSFEMVDISAPMGTWRLDRPEGQEAAEAYLHADRVARALRGKPRELGVDWLACITAHPMMSDYGPDQIIYNVYGWWPMPKSEPVMLMSTAFFELPSSGELLDRALANALVSGIVGLLTGDGTHETPPKLCPMYSNNDRELAVLVGRQRFAAPWRKRLAREFSDELPALEKMLGLFHHAQKAARRP